ncbi:MAG TPA: glycosyltransferase family 2 protein [Lacipirellulaceae bacterium]|jgi:glycosyltransferase involved in cell wall biosynthesis|nr:glycosyltransferase family 2 protein [Lacipirellulaceae bacterium]
MRNQKLLSVVVNNYNYARFVDAAVTSALDQNPELTEVIVVDDGSTDNSRDVITRVANGATTIFKKNGGQASAFNAGFEQAAGGWVIFLDADDVLLKNCAQRLSAAIEPGATKITWSMPIIGPNGERCVGTAPIHTPASGDLRQRLIDKGPIAFEHAPCSGNAWSRSFLETVFPMPEKPFRQGADGYLVHLSPLYGRTVLSKESLSAYRRHGENFLATKDQFEMRDELRQRYPVLADILAQHLTRCGLCFNRANWHYDYWDRLDEIEAAILEYVPEKTPFILVDDNTLNVGREFKGRPCRNLSNQDGMYVGPPENGDLALERLRTFRRQGVRYAVFMWHSFWWFECYPELRHYFEASAVQLHRSDTSMIYQLDEV